MLVVSTMNELCFLKWNIWLDYKWLSLSIKPTCSRDRGRCGLIDPISSPTGREVVMVMTSHEFLT